jgi:hypothetical protein
MAQPPLDSSSDRLGERDGRPRNQLPSVFAMLNLSFLLEQSQHLQGEEGIAARTLIEPGGKVYLASPG